MEEQKRFSISESVLAMLLEQVQLQPKVTADFITTMAKNDIRLIEEEKEDGKEK